MIIVVLSVSNYHIQYAKALKLIIDYDVDIERGMVELFILPADVPHRTKIMEAVAQHCYDRTQFQEAAQLYQVMYIQYFRRMMILYISMLECDKMR